MKGRLVLKQLLYTCLPDYDDISLQRTKNGGSFLIMEESKNIFAVKSEG